MGTESPSEMLLMHQQAVDAAHEAFVRAYRDDPEFRAWCDRGREKAKTFRWKDGTLVGETMQKFREL